MSPQAASAIVNLLGKSVGELRAVLESLGEPGYRGAQIYHALYAERRLDFAAMTNLPAALRERLARETAITLPQIVRRHLSSDGTVRYVLAIGEGKAANIETVFMPEENRQTICISTQAGCAVDCQFCLTATLGLTRNLTAGEIVGQVLVALEDNREASQERQLAAENGEECPQALKRKDGRPVMSDLKLRPPKAPVAPAGPQRKQTNIVLMGQGEPLLNYDAVMAALRILLDPNGVAIAPRHAALSTSGIIPGIERLAKEKVRPNLAISLNASSNEQRDQIMPINRKYPLEKLLEACRKYPLRPREWLLFEYVLLGGFNDSPEDARRVVRLLANIRAKVNLIPWNPGALPYERPSRARVEEFQRILIEKGVPCFIRDSRGQDVMAACGQLALSEAATASTQAS